MKQLISMITLVSLALWVWGQEIDIPQEQKSIITKLTATWCPNCGGTAWDTHENLLKNLEGKAVVLAAHYDNGSKLYSQTARDLLDNYEGSPFGQPIFYFNRKKIGSGGAGTESDITSMTNDAFKTSPTAQTGIRMEYDKDAKELVIYTRTKFFAAASGEYYLSVLQVEKEVEEIQSARSGMQVHKRVIREAVTLRTMGEELVNGAVASGETFDLNARMAMSSQGEAEKYQIVTILWRKSGATYEFVNTNFNSDLQPLTTSAFGVVAQPLVMKVQPNPMTEQSLVNIHHPSGIKDLHLNLFNTNGQLLKNWKIENGKSLPTSITLDRTLLPQTGIYWLQLKGKGQIWSKKILVQ